jgi:molybdate transport system permease protein
MSSTPTPDSLSQFRPKSDTAFFFGLGSLGGFYLFLIISLILALVVVPRWGKSDETKLLLMSPSIKEAIKYLEAANQKANGTVVAIGLEQALKETRLLDEPPFDGRPKADRINYIAAEARSLANIKLSDLVKKAESGNVDIERELGLAKNSLLDAVAIDRPSDYSAVFNDPRIRSSAKLSFVSCTISALLSLWVAVPIGYTMSRFQFRGKNFIDTILDVPIVLPPLVIGLGLLILFNNISFGTMDVTYFDRDGSQYIVQENRTIERMIKQAGESFDLQLRITNGAAGVVLAQFMVACAFAVRTMRNTFDQISPRQEEVAMTLGSSRGEAFWSIVLPQGYRGLMAAGTLAWARSLGEFGPILIFCGINAHRTEVMSSSVYLQFSIGEIEKAAVVSLLMIALAFVVLLLVRNLVKSDTAPQR